MTGRRTPLRAIATIATLAAGATVTGCTSLANGGPVAAPAPAPIECPAAVVIAGGDPVDRVDVSAIPVAGDAFLSRLPEGGCAYYDPEDSLLSVSVETLVVIFSGAPADLPALGRDLALDLGLMPQGDDQVDGGYGAVFTSEVATLAVQSGRWSGFVEGLSIPEGAEFWQVLLTWTDDLAPAAAGGPFLREILDTCDAVLDLSSMPELSRRLGAMSDTATAYLRDDIDRGDCDAFSVDIVLAE